jgi:hypothetical protein
MRTRVVTYCSGVKVARSLRSAPAQKAVSTSLARIRVRVAPEGPSSCIESTSLRSSASNCVDIALRAPGLFRERMRMVPVCEAGMFVTLITEDEVDERQRLQIPLWTNSLLCER